MGVIKQRQVALLGCILVLITGALYWPAIWAQFANIDDDEYVVDNPWVTRGLGFSGLKWAFTNFYAANWHPLTWISHQVDFALWGTFAGGHHLTGILLHSFNTLLVFLLLQRLTKSLWPSLVVAAFFGWHPLHVESVAWVAERKDVLSTFFFLLTLIAYTKYAESKVQTPNSEVEPPEESAKAPHPPSIIHHPSSPHPSSLIRSRFYWLALAFFALGLMSKQMLVTLPFILLLLDYWPLRRLRFPLRATLFLEKLPFFALAIAASAITLVAQHSAGAVRTVQDVPLALRALNAVSAYGHYLVDALWPLNLCVYYPLPARLPVSSAVLSGLALLALSWVSLRVRQKQPWALVGWLWFLGMLVPVIGLVQVGNQARADRYMYIPSIGLFWMIVWSTAWFLERRRTLWSVGLVSGVVALFCCLGLTRAQLGYWHDGIALCSRAIAVTQDNAFAHNNLGAALAAEGRSAEAIQQYREALRINPNYTLARSNLGVELAAAGQLDEAALQLGQALELEPRSELVHNNLGVILAQQHKLDAAVKHFQEAIRLKPDYAKAYLNYAVALQQEGEAGLAFTNYQRGLELDPAWPQALDKLAFLLATCPSPEYHDPQWAVKLSERANELTLRVVPNYLDTLAIAYAAVGEFSKAVSAAEQAQVQALRKGAQPLADRLARDLQFYRLGRCPEVDWKGSRSSGMDGKAKATVVHR